MSHNLYRVQSINHYFTVNCKISKLLFIWLTKIGSLNTVPQNTGISVMAMVVKLGMSDFYHYNESSFILYIYIYLPASFMLQTNLLINIIIFLYCYMNNALNA